ncbi:electron transport complex protein RnfC [Pseudodesulfovibrio portus]|uniref:Electron transport complex protein RnfC n=2 Tax=Pseudodesulfovibrio portus TaxID=231439 RepID=A0ABM8APW3_9BACT|nr:electron transport complex protein RnfC [Pseudodesulfovibrio portus]
MTLTLHCPLVKCGQDVRRGETIATSNVPDRGDIHAPFSGRVLHVDPYRIRIAPEAGETVDAVSLDGLSGLKLRNRLAELGADLPAVSTADTLIINAVDAEPTVVSRRELLDKHADTLLAGCKALAEAYHPASTALAVPGGSAHALDGTETTVISGHYPAGLDPLVAKAVTGSEAPQDTVVVGLETVFHVGRIMETGLPAMETMVTVGDSGRVIPLGTPVGTIIDAEGEVLLDRDRIVLGGALRGTAASSPNQGVDRSTLAVAVVSSPAPVAMDTACVGCGECVRRCPARLDPAMITSYAEFGMYAEAAREHVTACFECGLCGYFCIARRPMLQYIRIAKNELARAAAQTGEENQQ